MDSRGYLSTDRSIKPVHMVVGDLIVGHHDADATLSIMEIVAAGNASQPRDPPLEVVQIIRDDPDHTRNGVYYRKSTGIARYVDFPPRNRLWIIVRDRPGIPRLISEYPARCPACQGRVYVGLREVIHERGRCAVC